MDVLTSLYVACRDGDYEEVAAYLASGRPVDAPHPTAPERTALFVAAFYKQPHIVMQLLEAGASPHTTNSTGLTPLHMAAAGRVDDPEVAKMLIERGASVGVRDSNGSTPLHIACEAGLGEVAKYFITKTGADRNAVRLDGRTPELLAIAAGASQIVALFAAATVRGK